MTNQLSRENRSRDYLYKQLSDILRDEISTGKYKPGERLPSMDQLAAKYKVNKFTVQRALYELRAAGQIFSVPAMGTYVAQSDVSPLSSSTDSTSRPRSTITLGLISQILVPGNIGLYHTDIIEGMSTEISRHAATLVMLPVSKGETAEHVLEMIGNARLDAAIYLGPFDRALLKLSLIHI